MCMYVCMYVCMYACMSVNELLCVYVLYVLYVCMHVCMYVCTYDCMMCVTCVHTHMPSFISCAPATVVLPISIHPSGAPSVPPGQLVFSALPYCTPEISGCINCTPTTLINSYPKP